MKPGATVLWDTSQSLRFLHNISQLVRCEKNSSFALKNLGILAERFHERAIDPHHQNSLTVEQNLELEKEFANLADWVQCVKEKNLKQQQTQVITQLQVSLLQIVRYVLVKASNVPRDYYWSRNAVKLALETGIYCYNTEQWSLMEFCLNEAEFYQHFYLNRRFEFPSHFVAPYLLDSYLLSVLRFMLMYGGVIKDDRAFTRCVLNLESIELTSQQSNAIINICYNFGLEHFIQTNFNTAIFWLKAAYRFVKLSNMRKHRQRLSSKALFLMAVCLFKADVLENRDKILHILGCIGTEESMAVTELQFRALLPGKTHCLDLVRSALKLFSIYVKEDRAKLRENVLKVFNELEKNMQTKTIVELLSRILWHTGCKESLSNTNTTEVEDLLPHIKWICVEVAIRSCFKNDFKSGCYLWLQEIAFWTPSENANLESLSNILSMAETEAVQLRSRHLAYKWFRVLVRISRRHGSRTSLYINALRYALSQNTAEGFLAAKQLFDEELSDTELNIQLYRFKLLISVLDENQPEAVVTWLKLDAKYKKEADLESEYWEEGLQVLEMCTMAALKNMKMTEVAIHCLSAMVQEIKKRSLQTSLLVRVIRFHMKILLKWANDVQVEIKCIENLIATLIFAFLGLKESLVSTDGPHDSGGLELWFGDLAWSLGRKLNNVTPFHRHQLFKLSYKLLSLTPDKDEYVKAKITLSMISSVGAGINSKSHKQLSYRQILNSCLEIIGTIHGDFEEKDYDKIVQLYFFEFYILCELGDVSRLWEIFRRHQSNERVWGDPHFFEGLAALSSSSYQSFLIQILPQGEVQHFELKEENNRRDSKLQAKLTQLAIQSLGVSNRILASFAQPLKVTQMALNWKRIISLSSEHIFFQEAALKEHCIFCEKYRLFIVDNREHFDPSEMLLFFNYVWNVTVEIRVFGGPNETQRLIELVRNVACLSSELQKLYRSLDKDFKNNFNGVLDQF